MASIAGKSVATTRSRVEAIIRPALGAVLVEQLTSKQIVEWRMRVHY